MCTEESFLEKLTFSGKRRSPTGMKDWGYNIDFCRAVISAQSYLGALKTKGSANKRPTLKVLLKTVFSENLLNALDI